MINRLVIFGVGLMGGSFALAWRAASPLSEIVGIEQSADALAQIRQSRVTDRVIALDDDEPLTAALSSADLIVLAVPVAQTGGLLARIAPFINARAIITDMGSAKSGVVELARAALGPKLAQFVPAHPIAGSEASGVKAARADLYAGCKVVLCPLNNNLPAACERVAASWRMVGASVHRMSAAQHDCVFAAVSHLPHLLAFAAVEQLLAAPDAEAKFAFAGSGFRDFTRIAAASPQIWRDICIANRTALLAELDAYTTVLGEWRQRLEAGDATGLEAAFARAQRARADWGRRAQDTALANDAPSASLRSCNDLS